MLYSTPLPPPHPLPTLLIIMVTTTKLVLQKNSKKPLHQLVTCRLHAKDYHVCPLRLLFLIFLKKNKFYAIFHIISFHFQKIMQEEKSKNRILLGSLQSLYVETVQDTDIKISVKQLVQGWKEACINPQVI